MSQKILDSDRLFGDHTKDGKTGSLHHVDFACGPLARINFFAIGNSDELGRGVECGHTVSKS